MDFFSTKRANKRLLSCWLLFLLNTRCLESETQYGVLCLSSYIVFSLTQLHFFNTYSSYTDLSSVLYNNKQKGRKASALCISSLPHKARDHNRAAGTDSCIDSACDSDKLSFSHKHTHTYISTPGDRVMQPNNCISQFQHVRLCKQRPLRPSGSKSHILKLY